MARAGSTSVPPTTELAFKVSLTRESRESGALSVSSTPTHKIDTMPSMGHPVLQVCPCGYTHSAPRRSFLEFWKCPGGEPDEDIVPPVSASFFLLLLFFFFPSRFYKVIPWFLLAERVVDTFYNALLFFEKKIQIFGLRAWAIKYIDPGVQRCKKLFLDAIVVSAREIQAIMGVVGFQVLRDELGSEIMLYVFHLYC